MKNILAYIVITSAMSVLCLTNYSNSDETVLCLSEANRYVVSSDSSGKCFDGESAIRIDSGHMLTESKMVPLANFASADLCGINAQGSRVDIGFDMNGNGRLDADEIITSSVSCESAADTSDANTSGE
jgi:hypothetical protein